MRRIHQRSPVHFSSVFQAHEDNIRQSVFDGYDKMCAFCYRYISRFSVRHIPYERILHALINGRYLRMRILLRRKCATNDRLTMFSFPTRTVLLNTYLTVYLLLHTIITLLPQFNERFWSLGQIELFHRNCSNNVHFYH